MQNKESHIIYDKEYFEDRIEGAFRIKGTVSKITLDDMKMSMRATNALKRAGKFMAVDIATLSKEDILSKKSVGKRTAEEIMTAVDVIVSYMRREGELSDSEICLDKNREWALSRRIGELPFSKRDKKILREKGIITINELLKLTEDDLRSIGVGPIAAHEVFDFIKEVISQDYVPTLINEKIDISLESAIKVKGSLSMVTIEDIDLSVRARNLMEKAGIKMVEDIISLPIEDLNSAKGVGIKTIDEIMDVIHIIICCKGRNNGSPNLATDRLIKDLSLSNRAKNLLQRNKIFTVKKLLLLTDNELASFKGMGRSTYLEITEFLSRMSSEVTDR